MKIPIPLESKLKCTEENLKHINLELGSRLLQWFLLKIKGKFVKIPVKYYFYIITDCISCLI